MMKKKMSKCEVYNHIVNTHYISDESWLEIQEGLMTTDEYFSGIKSATNKYETYVET